MVSSCSKNLSALLREITSNHKEDFYSLNCFHSYTTEKKLKKHKNVCKNHNYCYVEMPKEDNKVLKYNQGEKSMKFSFIIYADCESLFGKISTSHNNPKKSSTTKITKHTHLMLQKISLIVIEVKTMERSCNKNKHATKIRA